MTSLARGLRALASRLAPGAGRPPRRSGRCARPGFDALLREALDASPLLLRADAMERSLQGTDEDGRALVPASGPDLLNPHE